MRIEREMVLPSSTERAWEILLDWERQAAWMRDADSVRVVGSQRVGIGTTIDVRTRVFNVPLFTERLRVIGWDPPRELRLAHGGLVRGVGTWALEPAGTGTRFRWTEDISLSVPLLGALALTCYRPVMRHLMGRALRDLQTLVGE